MKLKKYMDVFVEEHHILSFFVSFFTSAYLNLKKNTCEFITYLLIISFIVFMSCIGSDA